jgi:tetratricopeptide (TPR) repeat protein
MKIYAAATDKQEAFHELADAFLARQDTATLSQLVDLELKNFPDDPWVNFYQGKLHESADEYDAADTSYAKAMSLAGIKDSDAIRMGRVSARFNAGDGLSAYQDIEPRDKVFAQLCGLFTDKKDAVGLAKLVAKRQADAPQDPTLPLWDAAAKFLAGDYTGAIRLLGANRATIQAVNRSRFTDLYIRSLVRAKQFSAALTEANQLVDGQNDWLHIAVVQCAQGNVPDAITALNTLLQNGDVDAGVLYLDPDIGPALATPPFAAWRKQHPAPPARPATG